MNEWIGDLRARIADGNACVLVSVASIRGSAPREVGAKMLVTDREIIGTIGGGQLEYKCTEIACNTLQKKESGTRLRKFTLGANLGQCCGGVVEVLFESFRAENPGWLDLIQQTYHQREPIVIASSVNEKYLIDVHGICRYPLDCEVDDRLLSQAQQILRQKHNAQMLRLDKEDYLLEPVRPSVVNIAVFGAGHVGAATVNALSSLDCNIRWIDSRRDIFPTRLPENVQRIETEQAELEVAAMPADSCYLVMTHSHPLDQAIVQQILERKDFAYCGLIGSVSKRRRFEKRLRKLGVPQAQIDRLTCPIGIEGIDGKKPAEIAIAVAAEILQLVATDSLSGSRELPDNVRILR